MHHLSVASIVILDGRVLSRIDWKIYESLPKVPYKKITLA